MKIMAEEQEDNRSILALEVTEEQREAIRAFYVHNEWDFNEIDIVDQNYSNS